MFHVDRDRSEKDDLMNLSKEELVAMILDYRNRCSKAYSTARRLEDCVISEINRNKKQLMDALPEIDNYE